MSTMRGMNLGVMQSVAREFAGQSRDLAAVQNRIERYMRELDWLGIDATRFRQSWETDLRRQTRQLVQTLDSLADRIQTQVEEQRRTSEADGDSSSGPNPGGSGPTGGDSGSPGGSGPTGGGHGKEVPTDEKDPTRKSRQDDPASPYKDRDGHPQKNPDGSDYVPKHAAPADADHPAQDPDKRETHTSYNRRDEKFDWSKGKPLDPDAPQHADYGRDHANDDKPADYVGKEQLADKPLQADQDLSVQTLAGWFKGEGTFYEAEAKSPDDLAVWQQSVEQKDVDLGGGVMASGAASAAVLAASGAASASFGLNGGIPEVKASASGKAALVSLEAEGTVGNQYAAVTGKASAEVAAAGQAEASIGKDGVKASAGASAFAGVQASATAQADLGGVKPSVTGHAYAGAGVSAHATGEITASHVKASFDAGVALGVGAGVSFDVDIDVGEVTNNLKSIFHF